MNKITLGVVLILIVAGGYAFFRSGTKNSDTLPLPSNGEAMGVENSPALTPSGTVTANEKRVFTGTVLAVTASPLLDYNKADYDRAVASDKLVVLYFYANWCPICRAEFPKMQSAFNKLTTDDVVAFRVNYNDNETDDNERELAREHGVAYQHTKVFVRNGQRIGKWPDSWEEARYLSEIERALK